jgi:uncharacterized protein involved in exopolysaccharide biosynthesis
MNEFSPLDTFKRAYRLWWLVALLTFLGGILGLIFHRLQPPVYEARAVITAQVDLTQTWELTELEQDQAITAVMTLFVSPPVLQQTTAEAIAQGLVIDELVYEQNLFLERRRSNLELLVRDKDPEKAAALANLWAAAAHQALLDSHTHALRAQAIRQILYPYAGCPTPTPEGTPAGTAVCLPPPGEGQDLQKLETELNAELLASNAILPALIFDLSRPARVPRQPVALRADLLALVGALVGFLCGAGLASLRPLRPGALAGNSRGA